MRGLCWLYWACRGCKFCVQQAPTANMATAPNFPHLIPSGPGGNRAHAQLVHQCFAEQAAVAAQQVILETRPVFLQGPGLNNLPGSMAFVICSVHVIQRQAQRNLKDVQHSKLSTPSSEKNG